MKRKFFSIMLAMIAAVSLLVGIGMFQFSTFASGDSTVKYYEVDDAYSSFNNYASGPAYAGKTGVIAARATGGTAMMSGLTLTLPSSTTVDTANKSLVIDVNIYTVGIFSSGVLTDFPRYGVYIVLSDDTEMAATGTVYTAYDNGIVSTLTAETGGGYKLYASTGYNQSSTPGEPYNRVVVPFSSFTGVSGNIGIKSVKFVFEAHSGVSVVPKFTVGNIGVAESTSTAVGTVNNIYTPASDNFTAIGKVGGTYLTPGQFLIYAGNSDNTVTSQVLFKMPDELIGADGLVDYSALKGIVMDIGSDLTTTTDMSIMLFASNDATVHAVTTGYQANTKTIVSADGTVTTPTSKYFSKDHANSLHYVSFTASNPAAASASFYGTMPSKISPYFAINVPKGKTYYGTSFTINNIKIIADDTVYGVTTEGSITASKAKGFAGTEVILKSGEEIDKIASITVNGTALTATEIASVCSANGLKVVMEGDLNVVMTAAKAYSMNVTSATGGTVVLSQTRADAGERVRVLVDAEGGYKLKSLKVNGNDVIADVTDGVYVIKDIQADCTIAPEFEYTGEYYYETGTMGSLYNSYPGVAWADFDAVNVNVIKEWADTDADKTVGVTATGINATVGEGKYLVIKMQNLRNFAAAYQIAVNGQVANENYHYVATDKDFNVYAEATSTKITVYSVKVSTESKTGEAFTYTATGFNGYFIVPLSAFGEIQTINSVSLFTNLQKNYARFNLYSVALVGENGIAADGTPLVTADEIIWTADEENFEFYGTDSSYADVRYLEKGEVSIEKIVHSNQRDAMWWIAPDSLIDEDGYVDFIGKGIKGVVIDVENYNLSGIVFALRMVGYESPDQGSMAEDNIWQTSQSNHPGKWIYENGLVRARSTANFPYDDITGYFNGQWYIPLDITGLTSLYTGSEFSTTEVPAKWQPVFRLVVGTVVEEAYNFKINSIKFVTDDTPYASGAVTSSAVNGDVTGTVDGRPYGGTVNNNFILGSEITLNIKPDEGYVIESAKYTVSGQAPVNIEVAETGGDFDLIVTGDIVIQVICDVDTYSINYNLDGGTNAEDAVSSYDIESDTIVLKDATKKGYTFDGWYDADGNKVTEIKAGSTGDITLTAKWTKKGGCGNSVNGSALAFAVFVTVIAGTVLFIKRKVKNV